MNSETCDDNETYFKAQRLLPRYFPWPAKYADRIRNLRTLRQADGTVKCSCGSAAPAQATVLAREVSSK